jgi:hypothetical protein
LKSDEGKIQAEICKWLQVNGFYFFSVANEAAGRSAVKQMQMISMGLRPGVSDVVVVLPEGRSVFLEVKAPGGKQSPRQQQFQERVDALGHQYYIVRSVEDAALALNFSVDKKQQ